MNKCFVCNNESSENILELGLSPIANNLESDIIKSQNAKKYPGGIYQSSIARNMLYFQIEIRHFVFEPIVDNFKSCFEICKQ